MKLLPVSLMGAIALFPGSAIAEESLSPDSPPIAVISVIDQPTAQQVLEACLAGQVTTFPNPYQDVSPDHWAYEAVLNLYYCGPIRPGLPQHLIDRLTGTSDVEQAPLF